MFKFLGVFLLSVAALEASLPREYYGSKKPTTTKETDQNVIPSAYTLTITIDDVSKDDFKGSVGITFTTKESTKEITIDAQSNLKVEPGNVKIDGKAVSNVACKSGSCTITFEDTLDKGLLTIDYTGTLSKDMDGFYINSFTGSDGKQHRMFSTQFESHGAQKAFPCFDSPNLKATFTLTIIHPDDFTAYSNTGVSKKTKAKSTTTTFETTPAMSTYLLAFIIADNNFVCSTAADTITGLKTQICGPGTDASIKVSADLVVAQTTKILNVMKDFTGKAFTELDGKIIQVLTHAAIPEFSAGAMENWGLVTYREAALLSDAESSAYDKQKIQSIISHELAHQWFGDYMTLDAWSNIFLNEGFATFFEYVPAAYDDKQKYEMEKQFIVDQLQTALLSDIKNANPLVGNAAFNDVAYNKGGSILRMVQTILGDDSFKKALKDYVASRDNTEPKGLAGVAKLQQAIEDNLPGDLKGKKLMDSWFNKAGFPVIQVDLNETHFTFKQINEDPDWVIPVYYTTAAKPTTDQKIILQKEEAVVENTDKAKYIIVNSLHTGYYRVDYSDKLLEEITAALAEKIDALEDLTRSQLVDAQFGLARAGSKSYTEVIPLLDFLQNDTSYYTWTSAFRHFDYLLKHTSNKKVIAALKSHVIEQSKTVVSEVQTAKADTHIGKLRLKLVQDWACKLGDEVCVKEADDAFEKLKGDNPAKPELDRRAYIYCSGLRSSADPQKDFEALYNIYLSSTSPTEKNTIIRVLGCVSDTETRDKLFEKLLLTDDKREIKPQDFTYIFSSIAGSNGEEGVTKLIDFVIKNKDKLIEILGSDAYTSFLKSIAATVTTKSQSDKLGKENEDAGNIAKDSLKEVGKVEKDLMKFFKISGATSNSFYFFNFALVAVIYYVL